MTVRFWDMDHTLLDNDCDVSWKLFLIEKGIAPGRTWSASSTSGNSTRRKAGPCVFQRVSAPGICRQDRNGNRGVVEEHFETIVRPKAYAEAMELVQVQRASGDHTCMITATNIAIAAPVAEYFGFRHADSDQARAVRNDLYGKDYRRLLRG
jgi:phosphoserine phosphatase